MENSGTCLSTASLGGGWMAPTLLVSNFSSLYQAVLLFVTPTFTCTLYFVSGSAVPTLRIGHYMLRFFTSALHDNFVI